MCKYCETDAEKIGIEEHSCFGEDVRASIWIGAEYKEIYAMLNDITIVTAKGIKYCPMCGRKLD